MRTPSPEPGEAPPLRCVIITGPIGAGKSSLIDQVARDLNGRDDVRVYKEPVDEWKTMIESFGTDRGSAAYRFQLAVLDHYRRICEELADWDASLRARGLRGIALIERSPWDGLRVFIPANRDAMTDREYAECVAAAEELVTEGIWAGRLVIRLVAPIAECVKRIRRRGRTGELHLPLSYLETICQRYASMPADLLLQSLSPADLRSNTSHVVRLIKGNTG